MSLFGVNWRRAVLILVFLSMFVVRLAAAVSKPEELSACLKSYRNPDYQDEWGLSYQSWESGCRKGERPREILNKAENSLIASCVGDGVPVVKAGLMDVMAVKRLCSRGVSGRKEILTLAGKSLGWQRGRGMSVQANAITSITGRVNGTLRKGGLNALYGEHGQGDGLSVSVGASSHRGTPRAGFNIQSLASSVVGLIPPSPKIANTVRERYLKILIGHVVSNGASPEAVKYAKKILGGMLLHVPTEILGRLVKRNDYLFIIPQGKKLTQVWPLTRLAGKKTFDGRLWDNVRGISGVAFKDKKGRSGVLSAVAEENLLGLGGYRKGFVLLHEYGHIVRLSGLIRENDWKWKWKQTPHKRPSLYNSKGLEASVSLGEMILRVRNLPSKILASFKAPREYMPTRDYSKAIYDSVMRNKGTLGLGAYADSNSDEAFAQATAAYFGVGYNGEVAGTLRRRDPQMYRLMERVYGREGADEFRERGSRAIYAKTLLNLAKHEKKNFRWQYFERVVIFARAIGNDKFIAKMCGEMGAERCKKYFGGSTPKGF